MYLSDVSFLWTRFLPTLLLSLSLLACGGDKHEEKQKGKAVNGAEEPKGEIGEPAGKVESGLGSKVVEPPKIIKITPQEEDRVSLLCEELLDFLESKFSKDTIFFSRYRESFEKRIRDSKHFISLMREVYTGRSFSPMFFRYEDRVPILTDEGARLRDIMVEVGTHGLSEKDYRITRLKMTLDTIAPLTADYVLAKKGLADEKTAGLWSIVEGYAAIPDEAELKAALLAGGFSNSDAKLIREFSKFYPNLLQAKKKLNDAVQQVDILLLRGFFKFTLNFKYEFRAHPFKTTPEISLSHVKFREELRDDFDKAAPDFALYLLDLVPKNPVYGYLRTGLSRYRALRDEGEVDKYRIKRNLKKGHKGPKVLALARRLAAEGYLAPQHVGERFGKELLAAMKKYQRVHQLRVSGRTDSSTRSSLNVSMATRVKQTELGLQRWRESDIVRDDPDFYFRVNIPQFELEVWENNERIRLHRIVVGNKKEEVSIERKQRGRFNHTPLLSRKVTTVVLNPLWFPPPRLQKELLEDLRNEPDFFEKNNYGTKIRDDGTEIIFQKSGPGNALGLVKFLFPNEHHVYLHDTPAKALFDRPIRAYSHGCMRLDKPLDLAKFVLGKVNGMTRRDIRKAMEKEKEHYIKLLTPIPIYVEYNAVSADKEGWVYFFADVYKYDKAYWENRLPVENAEDLTPAEIRKLTKAANAEIPAGLEDGEDSVEPGPEL